MFRKRCLPVGFLLEQPQAPGQHVFGGSSRISEGTFRPPGNLFLRLIWRSFRPSVAWCFGVAKGAFWRLAAPPLVAAPAAAAAAAAGPAAAISFFFPESRRDVKPRGSMFLEVVPSFSSMVFRCGEGCVWRLAASPPAAPPAACSRSSSSRSSSSRPSSCNRFVSTRIQKGRQAPEQHVFGGRSVLQ